MKCDKKESCYKTLLDAIVSSNLNTLANDISHVGGLDDCHISIFKISEGLFIRLIDENEHDITRMYVELDRTMLEKLPEPPDILFEIEKEMKTKELKSFLWASAVL